MLYLHNERRFEGVLRAHPAGLPKKCAHCLLFVPEKHEVYPRIHPHWTPPVHPALCFGGPSARAH
eukprot:6276686-Amphidinium_carterae.1